MSYNAFTLLRIRSRLWYQMTVTLIVYLCKTHYNPLYRQVKYLLEKDEDGLDTWLLIIVNMLPRN